MAFEKTTLEVFKRRLKDGEYADVTGARRSVGKTKEMTDAEKKKATALLEAHPGPWAGGAKKSASAKKTAAPAKAKKMAKKPAGKPAAVAKKPAAAKKTAKRAKRSKAAKKTKVDDADARPGPEEEPEPTRVTPQKRGLKAHAPPPLPTVPVFTNEDVARNPLAMKSLGVELIGAFTQAYATFAVMAKEHPNFPLTAMIDEIGEGLQKAVALANATGSAVHHAAMRAGVIPGATMTPSGSPAVEPEQGVAMDVLRKAAAAAKKVHGVGEDATGPRAV